MSLPESVDVRGSALEPDRAGETLVDDVRRAAMLAHPTIAVAAIEHGRIRATNAPWKALFALPPDVSAESHVATLFPNAASADRFERSLQNEMSSDRGSRAIARLEHMLIRRDGQAFLAEVVVSSSRPGADSAALSGDAVWQVRDITVERTLRRELRDLEEYHRELSRYQPDVTFVIDRKGRISYASTSIESVLGRSVSPLLGRPFTALLEPSQANEVEQWLRSRTRRAPGDPEAVAGEVLRVRLLHEDGSVRSLACRARDCFSVPRLAGMVVQAWDPSWHDDAGPATAGMRRALLALAQTSVAGVTALLDGIAAATEASVVVLWHPVDGELRPIVAGAGRAGAGTSAGEPETREHAVPPLLVPDASGDGGPIVVADLAKHAGVDDALRAAFAAVSIGAVIQVPLAAAGGGPGWLVVGAKDARAWSDTVIDFTIGASLLARAAPGSAVDGASTGAGGQDDPLTGLPGRHAGLARLAASLDAIGAGESLVVIVVGVDRLRDVNDMHGFEAGDAILVRLARTLAQAIGLHGFVARVGGDEFLVVLRTSTAAESEVLVRSVADVASAEGTEEPRCAASVGIARHAFDGADAAALVLQADLALREAKMRGDGEAIVHHHKLAAQLKTRRDLDAEIETALSKNEFTLFYQPQVGLADGRIVGMEALLRWRHPTRGLLLPSAFIEAAFTRGLHEALTRWVLTQVCEQLASWRRAGDVPEVPVAINVEGRQFHDRRLPALVASALMKSGLPARLLLLDVKEQSLATDDAGLERVVRELARLGVRVVISDFSVGHASFRSLRKLQVAQIKLDGGFVGCIPDDPESTMVVASFVALAHRLKYPVVAEGVETRAQFEHLRALGCEAGQGFFFGVPLAAAEIRPQLVARRLPGFG